ncbi:MAG TPA: sugar-binding transcriptional regulator [Candidatus Angelobacter sp.]|nr:sugar-binding transcriptional regulator [Candidatus Angelobacter sp.]
MSHQDTFSENLVVKAAWYYYKENLTQTEISDLLNVTRNKVVRLLETARTTGIVQFNIKASNTNCLSLEKDLKILFRLKDAFIIPTPLTQLNESLAKAASQFLSNLILPNDLIGIGWGDTVSKTIQHLTLEPEQHVSLITLTGGVNYYFQKHRETNDGGLNKFTGGIHMIPSPFLTSSSDMAESFLSEPSVKNILHLASMAQHYIVGIGGLSKDATIVKEENMSISELTYIERQGAVGDILGQFYDANGELLALPLHEKLVGTPLAKLKELKNVIGVAGGEGKIKAIYGALKGNYLDTLVTDENTALALLSLGGDT